MEKAETKHILCHFEIPAEDMEKIVKFYVDLFGWEIDSTGDHRGINTGGEACGGIMKKQHPMHTNTSYIAVESVEEYSKKIENLGGTVVMTKTAVPNIGYFAVALDPERNCFGIFEYDKEAK